jgi:hypothetical protein
MELSLRPATARPAGQPEPSGDDTEVSTRPKPETAPTGGDGEADYHRYVLEISNRSLVDPEARRSIANLLQAILDAVDPDTGGDLQLLDLLLNLTADDAAIHEIEQKAKTAGTTWRQEELDF